MDNTENRIKGIESYMSSLNTRVTVIETIINDETKHLIESVDSMRRAIEGDPDLNVPPLYETIENMRRYHTSIMVVIGMMIIAEIVTLIISIMAITG